MDRILRETNIRNKVKEGSYNCTDWINRAAKIKDSVDILKVQNIVLAEWNKPFREWADREEAKFEELNNCKWEIVSEIQQEFWINWQI